MLKRSRVGDRRRRARFPIVLPAEVQIKDEHLTGKTANISSSGLLITYRAALKPRVGRRAQVRISWPSRSGCEQFLIIEGSVVRSGDGFVAIRRLHHEFVEIIPEADDPTPNPAVSEFSESFVTGKD